MSTIEWLNANAVAVAGITYPGEFVNDSIENEVACIVVTSSYDGDGVCIQGRPEDLVAMAKRIMMAALDITRDTAADPQLRSLYGVTQ